MGNQFASFRIYMRSFVTEKNISEPNLLLFLLNTFGDIRCLVDSLLLKTKFGSGYDVVQAVVMVAQVPFNMNILISTVPN